MTKEKKKGLFALLCVATTSMAVGVALGISRKGFTNFFSASHAAVHDASCVWNHYDAVMPTTSGHGSEEFWACCTHAGSFVLEEPTVTNPSQITDRGAFSGNFFNDLDSGDARYIPQLETASALDTIAPVTLSDVNITSGSVVPGGSSHIYGQYDFKANHGIDLWFEFSFTPIAADSWMYFYLFNQDDESGIVCRINTNRTQDDGIISCYIYSAVDYSGNTGTTVVSPAGAAGTFFYFPRSSGVKSTTTNIMHATAYCLNEETNLYRCTFTMGVKGEEQWYPSTNAEALENVAKSFDICLGENYFNNSLHRRVRFSRATVEDFTIYEANSEENALVYKDEDGSVLGKLNNPGTAKAPKLITVNKTFLGWFDPHGNRIQNGDAISGKVIVTSRYVATQTNMFVPSDANNNKFAAAKGGWFESSSFAGEAGESLPVGGVSNRYDLYFIYDFVSKTNSDNYAIFGFPFDMTDAQTRVHLRIDNKANGNLVGYIYGPNTSLGGAGGGTTFSEAGFRPSDDMNLLVHMAVYNASADGLTLLVELVNLGDGQVYQTTRTLTFNTSGLYAINKPARNMLDLMKGNCEYRITDAF